MPPRIAIVTTSITPYKIALFNELHKHYEGEFRVFFMFASEVFRGWTINENELGFDYEYLDNISISYFDKRNVFLNKNVRKSLKAYDPDLIINNNYAKPANIAAYTYARFHRKPFVMMEEYHTRYYQNRVISRILRKVMQHGATGFLACHKGAYAYLMGCGVPDDKIIVTHETVDMRWYAETADAIRQTDEHDEQKRQYSGNILTYVGQLIKRKNVDIIIDAVRSYIDEFDDDITVFIIGEGPLEQHYKAMASDANLDDNIKFTGYLQQDELLKYLAMTKALVLPSTYEIWGLVVNEAIAVGAVPLVAHSAGAAELVIDNVNGYTFHPRRPGELTKAIKLAFDNHLRMQRNIAETADYISLNNYVEAFVEVSERFRER